MKHFGIVGFFRHQPQKLLLKSMSDVEIMVTFLLLNVSFYFFPLSMSSFTTRVELSDASYSDYQRLHTAMQNTGFSRTITGDNGIVYDLPDAEYDCIGSYSIEEVRSAASKAASTTGKSHRILVTQGNRAWVGLTPISKSALHQ